ncbi:MAG: DUF4845 domain-containing protein [Gallionellales bacterium RIFOXYB12_FULL_54_9]|nr:MAG: DUF4845 domain-containing protein [Gallionellales bacterium RIFOXYB12_FULL_54_9]
MIAQLNRQRGLSFTGFIFGAMLLVLASVLGLKLIPAYMQYAQINKVFAAIAADPEMQKAPARDIRASFSKRAIIDDIKAIKAEDIEVVSDGGKPVLTAVYDVKIPVVANISLIVDFSCSSESK